MPPGAVWKEPRNWGDKIDFLYGLFANVRHSAIPGPFHFDSICDKPWHVVATGDVKRGTRPPSVGAWLAGPDSWPDRPAVGIRHHVAVGAGYEFLDFTSPSLAEEVLVNGTPVIETFRGRDSMPAKRQFLLRTGWYAVELQCFRQRRQRGQPWSTLDWEGPGSPRTEMLRMMRTAKP